jgi:hypothetical protein
MQATGTLRRFTISGQVIVLIAVLALVLTATAFALGRATQATPPTAVRVVSGQAENPQAQAPENGAWRKGRQPATGKTGPQLVP